MLMTRLKPLLMIMLLTLGVSGCYIPASFDAEINVGRGGYYKFQFEGYLAEVTLFNQIQGGKITPEEEAKKVEILERDFLRDSATKEFTYFKQGHFNVKWEKEGDLLKSRMVSFSRRNENMLSLAYNKNTGIVSVAGTPLSKLNAQRMLDSGLTMRGQLRVITDANVKSHNATSVKKTKGREKMYTWDIKSPLDPSPKLTFIMR